MKAGRRIADPAKKAFMRTHRKDRHASIAPIAVAPFTAPGAPKYVTPEGKIVRDEEVRRVTAIGITETDPSFLRKIL